MAYEKPPIIEGMEIAAIADEDLALDRLDALVEALYADMTPGEKPFYERCTVCHGPRDLGAFTQLQWKAITPSMFPRAGPDDAEAAVVMDFLMANASDAAK